MTRIVSLSWSIVLCVLISCTAGIAAAAASEHTVAPSGAEFFSIQEAIDWSSSGDTVTVESGTYAESIRIDKRIFLTGTDSGNGPPVINPGRTGNAVELRSDGCTVEGFVISTGDLSTGILVLSDQNTIRKNVIKNNAQGISLSSAEKNTLSGNTVTNNQRTGIALESSNDNLIEDNTISANSRGISLDEHSLANRIARNNIINTQNVLAKSTTSVWSTTTPLAYTYLGMQAQSRMGNYWSDYKGRDANGDGIGDSPYVIALGGNPVQGSAQSIIDAFPLMDQTEYYKGIRPVPVRQVTPAQINPVVSQVPATPAVTGAIPVAFPAVPSLDSVISLRDRVPWGTITLALGLLVLAILAGAVVWRYRKQRAQVPADLPKEPSEFPDELADLESANFPAEPEEREPADLMEEPEDQVLSDHPFEPEDLEPADHPDEPEDRKPARATVIVRPSRSPATTPVTVTSLPKESTEESTEEVYYPSISDQKYYFPRELENKYTDIGFVGRGGVAWVFSAIRKTDGLKVAVKIPISFDEMTGRSFLNEIKAWETLRHENIVEVLGVNILPVPYVEMEFVPSSLEDLEKPLPVWMAVHIIRGVADGLRYAHEHGFIHRDIKPHNILLDEDCVPKITDWGMSKVLAADVKKSSIAGFSLSYAAPEQVSPSEFGRTDKRTDIYQLGVVFYEMVTGSIPFGGESIVEVGNAILREEPLPPSEYNPDAAAVEKIICRCLEKDPANRYQSAAELLDALSRYLDEDDE